jgi:hypothetical protein
MIMSTVDPETLIESLAKEEVVLMPLAEYQALLAELEALQEVRDQLQTELMQSVEIDTSRLKYISDSVAGSRPVSLQGIWEGTVVDEEDFVSARRSLYKAINDQEL